MFEHIPFNKPFLVGKETDYIKDAVASLKISGDGIFTKKCHNFFETQYGFKKVLLTTSCTDALEMAAILLDIKEGDEVIAPSYTFVSTVNAFVLRGAKIIFADSSSTNPNIDADNIEQLITPRTKVIVPVHYAGIACDMDKIMSIANKYNLYVVEDAAQSIDSFYKGKPLGGIGHLSAFSFHETKNIISGEGGMLVINDDAFIKRAEIIREKGTNRSAFFRGEIDKYSWVDVGSSFLPSEIISAFLFAQLEYLNKIQHRRKEIWNLYNTLLLDINQNFIFELPSIPNYATNNAHMYYLVLKNIDERTRFISYLKSNQINTVFHYLSLDKSIFYSKAYPNIKSKLPNADRYSNQLVRLPMYYELKNEEVIYICQVIKDFYRLN